MSIENLKQHLPEQCAEKSLDGFFTAEFFSPMLCIGRADAELKIGGVALKFEWDEDKNQLNLQKHGIDFETAMFVFNDLQRIEIYDMEHSINEDRYNTIGMVNDVLFVVYTERKENIRIISARLATKTERSIYYDTDSYFG